MTNRNYHSCFIYQHAWRCSVSQCRKCREKVAICFSSRSYSPSNDLFRIFWLDVLQKSRRSCNSSTEKLSLKSSVSQKVWVLFFPTTLFTFTLWKITEGKIRIFGDLILFLSKTLSRSVRTRWQISRTRKISRPRCLRVIFTRKHFSKVSPTKIGLSSPGASQSGDSRPPGSREQTVD